MNLNAGPVGLVGRRGSGIVFRVKEARDGRALGAGNPKVTRSTAEKYEMTASVTEAENYGPCIEDDLKLRLGGGCENRVRGSKIGDDVRAAGEFPIRFQRSIGRS